MEFKVEEIKYRSEETKKDKYGKQVRDWMIQSAGNEIRIFSVKADFEITAGMTIVTKEYNGKYYGAHDKANPPQKGGFKGGGFSPVNAKATVMAAIIGLVAAGKIEVNEITTYFKSAWKEVDQ